MRVRYQGGYLRLGQRKKGPDRWEFLWWDFEANGTRVRRKAIIGTVQEYPNLENAWQASNGLRVSINETRNRQREQTITVADLVDHYSRIELANDQFDGGKSHATKTIYTDFLTRWVKPIGGVLTSVTYVQSASKIGFVNCRVQTEVHWPLRQKRRSAT